MSEAERQRTLDEMQVGLRAAWAGSAVWPQSARDGPRLEERGWGGWDASRCPDRAQPGKALRALWRRMWGVGRRWRAEVRVQNPPPPRRRWPSSGGGARRCAVSAHTPQPACVLSSFRSGALGLLVAMLQEFGVGEWGEAS